MKSFLPLLAAFARRLATMPSLKEATLRFFPHSHRRREVWRIQYLAPGSGERDMDEEQDVSRLRMVMEPDHWRPNAEVMRLLRDVGRIRHGKDTAIIFCRW